MLLDSLPELQALRGDLQRLAALQNTLAEVLPENLAASTNVAVVKAGELTLTSHSPAVVAKLRHIAPRILTFLQDRQFEITGIRLQVQVSTVDNPLPQKQIFLSPEARVAIEALSRRLSPSPLHTALTRLGNRGKTTLK
jgi:hypothetical protein